MTTPGQEGRSLRVTRELPHFAIVTDQNREAAMEHGSALDAVGILYAVIERQGACNSGMGRDQRAALIEVARHRLDDLGEILNLLGIM